MEKRLQLARGVVVAVSVVLSSASSWFFTMVGAYFGGMGMRATEAMSVYSTVLWTTWGILWGAVCGYYIAHFLVKRLLIDRNALYGLLYGLIGGAFIGTVNALLTTTFPVGTIIGLILGPLPGLIMAGIFLNIYKGQENRR